MFSKTKPEQRIEVRTVEYFAYGSNMNLDQMARRCPDAEVVGPVRLNGYRLAFAGSPHNGVATILPAANSHVYGVLWKISAQDEKSLDRYEGFPRLYGKETVTVKDEAGREHQVMAYTMNAPYRDCPAVPDASYLYGIVAGCRQNRISPLPVYKAFERVSKEVGMQREHRSTRRRGFDR